MLKDEVYRTVEITVGELREKCRNAGDKDHAKHLLGFVEGFKDSQKITTKVETLEKLNPFPAGTSLRDGDSEVKETE